MPFALWALIVSAAAARIASRLARNRFVPPSSLWDTGCAPCIAPDYQLRFEGTVAFCTPARLARSNASGDTGDRRGGFTDYRVWTRLHSMRNGIGIAVWISRCRLARRTSVTARAISSILKFVRASATRKRGRASVRERGGPYV